MRCLVVEDDPVASALAMIALSGLGLAADTAKSGEIAQDLARSHSYQIVILDHHLGSMVGHQALEALSLSVSGAELIVMTANPSPELRERYKRLGATSILQKPFAREELEAVVAEIVSNRDSRRVRSEQVLALNALFTDDP